MVAGELTSLTEFAEQLAAQVNTSLETTRSLVTQLQEELHDPVSLWHHLAMDHEDKSPGPPLEVNEKPSKRKCSARDDTEKHDQQRSQMGWIATECFGTRFGKHRIAMNGKRARHFLLS